MAGNSLWGNEFVIEETPKVAKKVIEKIKKPKTPVVAKEKVVKSKGLTTSEKLALIREEVYRILGVYKEKTVVLRTKEELHEYIDAAILNGEIAVDTETNNSLVPVTCKLMGLCLYTPGMKNAYIPVNHVNIATSELLPNQVTEQDIKEELDRLGSTRIITHNGKFDYEVIKCTCNSAMNIYWDTMIGARILDENERAGLKQQYISKIDPSIEKYSIEQLFEGIEYAFVEPELFALYAATDSFMTYELYKWQKNQFATPGYEQMFNLFMNIEMPIVTVCAEMELTGIEIDKEYSDRLSCKYHKKLEEVDAEIATELKNYNEIISKWRLTPEANHKEKKVNKKGEETWSKSKNEQLQDPISVTSPTQLAIFFYDVLRVGVIDKKSPRGTGEEILESIAAKTGNPLCKLILKKRGLEKIIGTYVDKLPQCVVPETGRLHAHFNQIGADCVVGDTPIVTEKGIVPIQKIVPENLSSGIYTDFCTSLVNENNELELTSHCIKFDNVPTVKVKTLYGFELEGTPNHPIRVLDKNISSFRRNKSSKVLREMWNTIQWKNLSDIRLGDLVLVDASVHNYSQEYIPTQFSQDVVNITHSVPSTMPEFFDEDFAELLGMYHADGAIVNSQGSVRLQLYNEHEEVIGRFKYLCEKLFNQTPKKDWTDGSYISGVYITGKKLIQLLDYVCTGKSKKSIPQVIYESRDSVFYSYLRGCSLDSGYNGEEKLNFHFMSKYDCNAVQQRLLKQGILSSAQTTRTDEHQDYKLVILPNYCSKFIQLTGPLFRKTEKKIIPDKKYTFTRCYTHNNLIAVPVVSIKESFNTVFDFTLPRTHSFLGGGFICHNTGRFSSSEPNLQNIPSHLKEIRMMFTAGEGKILVGSDFSQQEPRLLASMAMDDQMINAYKAKKDLYATIATGVYHNDYWDNMEKHQDGSPNPAGKKRRSNCKSILLGLMYGRGAASIAEQIGASMQEAQKIIDSFFQSYPKVKQWIDKTQADAKINGYVEDHWGRRRRLPDILKPLVEVEYIDKNRQDVPVNFNPLIGAVDRIVSNGKSDIEMFRERALASRSRQQMQKIQEEALAKGIKVHENGGFIAQAERQCVNARIQGGAATISKIGMIKVFRDEELKNLGFKLQICVHDELIGECPEENANAVAERLSYVMAHCVENDIACPMKCDPTIEKMWYWEDYSSVAKEEYDKLLEQGKSSQEAFEVVLSSREECLPQTLMEMLELNV